MKSTNTGCNQWLSLAKITLKVPHAGRNRSLVVRTSRCGKCISLLCESKEQHVQFLNWHCFSFSIPQSILYCKYPNDEPPCNMVLWLCIDFNYFCCAPQSLEHNILQSCISVQNLNIIKVFVTLVT